MSTVELVASQDGKVSVAKYYKEGRLKSAALYDMAEALRLIKTAGNPDKASPQYENTWTMIDEVAPQDKRTNFLRNVFHPLAALHAATLRDYFFHRPNELQTINPRPVRISQGKMSFYEYPGPQWEGVLQDFKNIAGHTSDAVLKPYQFHRVAMMEPEQLVRLARYTAHSLPESTQADFIRSFYQLVPGIAMSLIYLAKEKGLINTDEPRSLKFMSDMIQRTWFKMMLYKGMDTGNGFWIPTLLDKNEGERNIFPTSWWEFPASFEEGAVFSTELEDILAKRKARQQRRAVVPGRKSSSESMRTAGCPLRFIQADFSTKPQDVNYLSPSQLTRLTVGENPTAVLDPGDPYKLHIQLSVAEVFLDFYIKGLQDFAPIGT